MPSEATAHVRLIGLGLFVVALAALLAFVFDRIGIPQGVLAALAAALAMGCIVLAGLSGATMGFPAFLTADRSLSGTVTALTAAMISAPAIGFGAGAPAAVGLVLLALVAARGLSESGAAGWADYLRIRFGSRGIAICAALIVALAALVFAAAVTSRLVDLLSAAAGVSRPAASAVAGVLLGLLVVAGGTRSVVRAALMAGVIGLACGLVLTAVAVRVGAFHGADIVAVFSDAGWLSAAALALMLPSSALWVGTARDAAVSRRGLLGAALLVLVLDLVTPTSGVGLLGTAAPAVVAFGGAFAAAAALCLAAAMALGRDLPGPPGRYTPLSRRFARVRLAGVLAVAVSVAAGGWRADMVRRGWDPALAVLVGAILPPALLGLMLPRARALAAWVALLAGLLMALAVEGGWIIVPGGPAVAGVWGGCVGLAAGVLVALLSPLPGDEPGAEETGRGATPSSPAAHG